MTNQLTISREILDYAEALLRHGMFVVDSKGKGSLTPLVGGAVDGIHQILAGADVTLKVAAPGKMEIVSELNTKLEAALGSVNPVSSRDGDVLFSP